MWQAKVQDKTVFTFASEIKFEKGELICLEIWWKTADVSAGGGTDEGGAVGIKMFSSTSKHNTALAEMSFFPWKMFDSPWWWRKTWMLLTLLLLIPSPARPLSSCKTFLSGFVPISGHFLSDSKPRGSWLLLNSRPLSLLPFVKKYSLIQTS